MDNRNSFFSVEELKDLGFRHLGENVSISRYASFYGADSITIGDNVRIDDFCILSGNIHIGNHVHIAAYSSLFAGNGGIIMEDYTCVSSRVAVYAVCDDFSGAYMTNPTVPDEYRNVTERKVVLKKHVLIGTGSTIMPGVIIGEGTSVGSMSLVNKSLEEWGVYAGIPCKLIKPRKKDLLEYEKKILNSCI